MRKYLSFDIGGTNIKYGILTEDGEILKKDKFSTNSNGEIVLQDICKLIKKTKETDNIQGAAFSCPGFVNINTGELITAGALLDWYNLNLKEYIEKETNVRVEVENDVNCVALAEKWKGNAIENKDFICLTIGTGIGGAIVIDEKLYRGKGFFAGEFGYMLTVSSFNERCGNKNLSTTASVYFGIRKNYAEKTGLNINQITGEDVFNQAEKGDEIAIDVIDHFYKNLAVGVYNLVFTLNPEKILIGGAISKRKELLAKITSNVKEIIKVDGTLTEVNLDNIVDIERCYFNNDSGLIGALYHFLTTSR